MFKQFTGGTGTGDSITVPGVVNDLNVLVPIPIRYARKSKLSLAEGFSESYPQSSIWDYFPEIDTAWAQNFQQYVDGFHDFSVPPLVAGQPNLPAKAYLFEEPIRLLFRYDFTFYVNSPMARFSIADYMMKRFSPKGQFILNSVNVPGANSTTDTVGDVAGYNMLPTEVQRNDGIFEMNYEFTSKLMVLVKDPVEVDLITNFNTLVTTFNIK